jgi:hypothetical protein
MVGDPETEDFMAALPVCCGCRKLTLIQMLHLLHDQSERGA